MSADLQYSVSELTLYIKHRLENDEALRSVQVTGEISNLRPAASGHVYFTLKDEQAQLSCAMWRSVAQNYRDDMPGHGEQVTVLGQISVYPPRGNYQLIVRAVRKAGLGDLHRKFLELRDRLREEGLFEEAHKKPLPAFPKRIGVVTSPTGAVIRDILDTIRRRYPHVEVILAPTVVQGDRSAASIVRSLARLNALPDLDLIILARGGGSLEDLWSFNEEIVARAIFESEAPVISGVGHETDVTIADFVADLRAATPTAAAEHAVPVAAEVLAWLDDAGLKLKRNLMHFVNMRRQLLDDYTRRLERLARHRIDFTRQLLDDREARLEAALKTAFSDARHRLDVLESQLQGLDERKVLARGYTVTELDGKRISKAADARPGDVLVTHYLEGKTRSRVEKSEENGKGKA